jgi:hypothetical protein
LIYYVVKDIKVLTKVNNESRTSRDRNFLTIERLATNPN